MKPLPNTTYAVLGLLSFGQSLSGYEIRKWAEGMRFFYWSPAQSQIYSELKRLQKLGLVSAEKVPQDGKPDKKLYQINDEGRAVFQQWLNDSPVEPTIMKHGLALRLFFGHAADPEKLKAHLHKFIADVNEALGQLAIVEEYTQSHPTLAFQALTAEWGTNYYQAELATAKKMLERLEEMEPYTEGEKL